MSSATLGLILGIVFALPAAYILINAGARKLDEADEQASEEYLRGVFDDGPRSIRELVDLGPYDRQAWE